MRYEDGIIGFAPGKFSAEPGLPREDIAVSVTNLRKRYRVYQNAGQKLKEIVTCGLLRCHSEFWALRDVSFDLAKGETLGIVGRNGSGKSTLLQIICGTVAPTAGTVKTWGKIAGLLELGAGFHPEFTGRENVYMYGAVLGLTREEIHERFHSIVEFSELSDFIDQPVKTYSNGMFVRLAFSTAINVDPDIMVVDEALAVGDTLFQAKCFKKFRELQAFGKTILFVTHSDDLLTRLCSTAMVLDGGRIRFQGSAKDALNVYRDVLWGPKHEMSRMGDAIPLSRTRPRVREMPSTGCSESGKGLLVSFLEDTSTDDNFPNRKAYNPDEYRYGDYRARLVDYLLVSDGRYDVAGCSANERLDVYVKAYFEEELDNIIMGLTVQTLEGVYIYGNNTRDAFVEVKKQLKDSFLNTRFSFVPRLLSGNYLISLGIAQQDETGAAWSVDRRYNAIILEISNNSCAFGVADLEMIIEVGL